MATSIEDSIAHGSMTKSNAIGKLLGFIAVIIVLISLAPIAVIILSWSVDQGEIWQHLAETQLPTLLRNTVVLVLAVGIGVTIIGVSLAWLTVMCEFPGRRWLDWALMLPMAMPAYVLGFASLGLLDFSGPVQQYLHQVFQQDYNFVDVRSEGLVICVLVLVLYPYVYMLSRSAFLAQGSDVIEAARVLGLTRWGAFFRVALPMARPAIVAGVSLAVMETLADFGTVAVFNYDTFTTAIYKSWFGFFSLQAAAQLASLLLLFVALALFSERSSRGNRSFIQSSRKQHRNRFKLSPVAKMTATTYCLLILLLAFILPVVQLLQWSICQGLGAIDGRYINLLKHTIILAFAAAAITVAIALILAFTRRRASRKMAAFIDLASLGYALPGSVLAVGIMLSFAVIDREVVAPIMHWMGQEAKPLLIGSVFALVVAYWIRFLAVASGSIDSSLARINPSIPQAARSLGANNWRVLRQIYLPMLRPGMLTAAVLVLVDVMKEMPATLLLRPFGWDTLAVRIYEMTSEGEWERAAIPALTLVMIGLLPVVLAVRQSSNNVS